MYYVNWVAKTFATFTKHLISHMREMNSYTKLALTNYIRTVNESSCVQTQEKNCLYLTNKSDLSLNSRKKLFMPVRFKFKFKQANINSLFCAKKIKL